MTKALEKTLETRQPLTSIDVIEMSDAELEAAIKGETDKPDCLLSLNHEKRIRLNHTMALKNEQRVREIERKLLHLRGCRE